MAEHDYDIANAAASTVRTDINNALLAIVSQNSKITEPSTTYAFMWWYDTTADLLKMRNAADTAWITIGKLDQTGDLFIPDINGLSLVQGDILYHNGTNFSKVPLGTAGQILSVNTGATAPEWGSGGLTPTIQIFTTSGTWTKPAGCKFVEIIVTGGGGGGTDYNSGSPQPGNGGGTAIKWLDVSSISSSTITVGAGGSGVTTSSRTAGGASSWADGVNTITGQGAKTTVSRSIGTGGDINLQSGYETDPQMGRSSYWGEGEYNNATAQNPGSGGGARNINGVAGGGGADGIVVIKEFY